MLVVTIAGFNAILFVSQTNFPRDVDENDQYNCLPLSVYLQILARVTTATVQKKGGGGFCLHPWFDEIRSLLLIVIDLNWAGIPPLPTTLIFSSS